MPRSFRQTMTLLECGIKRTPKPLFLCIFCTCFAFAAGSNALFRTGARAIASPMPPGQKATSHEFVAVPIDGEPISGRLAGLKKPWRIVLQAAERISLEGSKLVALRRQEAPAPALASGAYVLLANGNRLRATAHLATQEALRVHSELLGNLEIPLERVQAIVLGAVPDAASRERLEKTLLAGDRKQDVVVLTNGDEMTGTLTGFDDESLQLERPGGPVSIQRGGARAIAFSSDLISFPSVRGFYAEIILADGSELSVLDAELSGANVRGQTAFGREFSFPLEQLVAVEFRNGRVTYLSDLQPIAYKHTPYLMLAFPYRRDRRVVGGPITLRGQVFRKGLGMHSRSEITYNIDRRFRRFEALVGIDDDTAGQGSVVFRVLLDGAEAWQSGPVTGQTAPKRVQADVSNAQQLTLIVDFGSLGDVQDHADWADARLVE
jgi:hypothetical protein